MNYKVGFGFVSFFLAVSFMFNIMFFRSNQYLSDKLTTTQDEYCNIVHNFIGEFTCVLP